MLLIQVTPCEGNYSELFFSLTSLLMGVSLDLSSMGLPISIIKAYKASVSLYTVVSSIDVIQGVGVAPSKGVTTLLILL